MTVHNHGSEEEAGLRCREIRLPNGSLRGECLLKDDVILGRRSINDYRKLVGMDYLIPAQRSGYETAKKLSQVFRTKVAFTPMSSSYYVLCLSHDPAMQISELRRDDDFRAAMVMGISDHQKCDTLLVRVSGGPVEIGCPGMFEHCSGHASMVWVDLDVLRLMEYFEPDDPRTDLQKLFSRPAFRCWTYQRRHRLRDYL